MTAIGCPEAADNPDYAHNDGRARHARAIDGIIGKWAASHSLDEVLAILHEARIPAGRVYDIADICADPHYQARNMILDSQLDDGTPIKLPEIVPKPSGPPGARTPRNRHGQEKR